MVSSASTSNVGLMVCTTWAFEIYLEQLKYLMGQAQIPTIPHQISNAHLEICMFLTTV